MSNDIIWVFSLLFLLIISKLSQQLPTANNWCKLTRFLEYYSNLNNRVHQTGHHQRDLSVSLHLKRSSQNPNLNPINHPLEWPQHVRLMVYIHLNRTCGRLKECPQIQVVQSCWPQAQEDQRLSQLMDITVASFLYHTRGVTAGAATTRNSFKDALISAKCYKSYLKQLEFRSFCTSELHFFSSQTETAGDSWGKVDLKTRFLFVFELEPLHLCCLLWLRVRREV